MPPAGKRRWWWLRMVAICAALVAGLLAIAFTAPVAYQRYRAWRYPPEYVQKIYDVRDLTFRITSFCGLAVGPASKGLVRPDPDGGLLSGGEIAGRIRKLIGEDKWTGDASIEERNGQLIVVHVPEVHEKISVFLKELRTGGDWGVILRTRFMVGADFAAILKRLGAAPGASLSDADAEKLVAIAERRGAETRNAMSVTDLVGWEKRIDDPETEIPCSTGWQVYIERLASREYLYGFDESGKAVKSIVWTGMALNVRPKVSECRTRVMLRLDAGYCGVLAMQEQSTPRGEVEVPVLDERRLKKTVTLPDGEWTALVLEPGTKDSRAEGPILVLVGVQIVRPSLDERFFREVETKL